jgi:putative transcriptional regulator
MRRRNKLLDDERPAPVLPEIDVRDLRRRLNMSRSEFALRFGFNLSVLRSWERGWRRPVGSARTLLFVIQSDPEIVSAAISMLPQAVPERF